MTGPIALSGPTSSAAVESPICGTVSEYSSRTGRPRTSLRTEYVTREVRPPTRVSISPVRRSGARTNRSSDTVSAPDRITKVPGTCAPSGAPATTVSAQHAAALRHDARADVRAEHDE